MDSSDKIAQALRLARSTGGKLELDRAKEARRRAPGQVAPSKYMPGVPRQVRADGGRTGFLQKAHFNPSVDALKRLAKNSKYETARIAIDKDNNLWAGSSDNLVHADLGDGAQWQNIGTHKIVGYVTHHNGDYVMGAWDKDTGLTRKANHPIIDQLEQKGIENGTEDKTREWQVATGGAIYKADGGKIPEKEAKKNLTAWHKDADMSVKNPDGSSKVFYHRTSKSFDTFNVNKEGDSGPALFFGDNPEILPQMHNRKSEGDHIMPVHLNMRSPLLLDEFNLKEMRDRFANGSNEFPHYIHPRVADNLKSLGYDGIVAEDIYGRPSDGNEYIVFHPHQVKSAIGNSGQFDPEDPNITKAEGGEVDDKDLTPHINNPMSIFPKPQRMFPEEARPRGGQYLAMPDKRDVTGHKAAAATIGVQPGGKPFFKASSDAVDSTGSAGRGTATVKTNLFKQKAGWRWSDAPEGHEATDTIVSVEHRGKHHYALNAHFPKGVNLARYENSPSEPRLRPTTTGNVELGPQAGSIVVRGKEHPVYKHVIVKAAGGVVGA